MRPLPGCAAHGFRRVGPWDDIDDLANRYVDEWAPLNPIGATYVGIAGHDDQLDDLSPEGYAAQADLTRRTLAELDAIEPDDERERVAKEAMQERLGLELARYDAGEAASELNVISSALHGVRQVFDLMPTEGEEAAANIAARLGRFPARAGAVPSARCCEAADARARQRPARRCSRSPSSATPGPTRTATTSSTAWPTGWPPTGALARRPGARRGRGHRGDRRVRPRSCASELAPRGPGEAGGRPGAVRSWPRSTSSAPQVDLDETYAWGFEELARLEARDARGGRPRSSARARRVDEAVAALDADPARQIPGKEAFRDWMQELADKAIGELHGTHFDIPEQVRRIECCLAPTSDGGIYYTGPSEDFTRPGRMWWAVPQGIDRVLHLARGDHRLPRGRARPSPAGRPDRRSAPSCSTAGSGCCAGAPATARAGRCTPSG